MSIILRFYTSTKCPDDTESLTMIGQSVAFTRPLEFYYNNVRLMFDVKRLLVIRKHWGVEVTLPVDTINIPEGYIGYMVPVSYDGSGDDITPVDVYEIVLAPPSLQMRFSEYIKTGLIPKPQYSGIDALVLDVSELADLTSSKWNFGFDGTDYSVTIDGSLQFSPNLWFLHQAILKKFAEMSLKNKED